MSPDLAVSYKSRCAGAEGGHMDIKEHLPYLEGVAYRSGTIVEFGVRTGNSTCAFLHGLERRGSGILQSYDINEPGFNPPQLEDAQWAFIKADTAKLDNIPVCDVLFIDTLHTEAQVTAELRMHPFVEKFIILHDSVNNGDRGELNEPGITRAVYKFLAENWATWRVYCEFPNNNGLLVLARIER